MHSSHIISEETEAQPGWSGRLVTLTCVSVQKQTRASLSEVFPSFHALIAAIHSLQETCPSQQEWAGLMAPDFRSYSQIHLLP